jgi:hypothetical protein
MEIPISPDSAGTPVSFPDEAFECPYCGQLLGSTCRVCVSCKLPIDPARIQRSVPIPAVPLPELTQPQIAPVRFSWPILFAVLGGLWVVAAICVVAFGADAVQKMQLPMSLLPLVCGLIVFWDARQMKVRKPLRWALGVALLWIVFFPWYLARRQKLNAPVPFVESESGAFTRVMILVIFISFLLSILAFQLGWPVSK